MNTNKKVEWRRFIVFKKVEQINDHLFIDTYKSPSFKLSDTLMWTAVSVDQH